MKSQSNSTLLHIVSGLLKDYRMAYPQDGGDVVRDFERLTLLSKTRGLGLYTLDLPSLDKALLQGLTQGRLQFQGPLSHRVSKKCHVPRLFRRMWLRVFDKSGMLLQEPDVTVISFLRQIFCLGKKLVSECTPARIARTVKEYIHVERELPPPTLEWGSRELGLLGDRGHSTGSFAYRGNPSCDSGNSEDSKLASPIARQAQEDLLNSWQSTCDELMGYFPVFHPIAYMDYRRDYHGRPGQQHGPGAVSDRSGKFDKFEFPTWSDKLEDFFPFRQLVSDGIEHPSRDIKPSKLVTVPKDATKPRLIASEPTSCMFTQQLVRRFLEEYISYSPLSEVIDFRSQAKSRDMALRASRTGKLSTVDLASASDRMSCYVIERMFRKHPSLLYALHSSRTSHISITIGGMNELLEKRKFASQGSAVTFPIQTLLFMSCILAVAPGTSIDRKVRRWKRHIRAFGDDLIIPKEWYADLKLLLETLGFRVNDQKSFANGFFRESCGMDAYRGYDVTPVKPMSLSSDGPEARCSLIDFSNNLFKRGFWNAAKAVESTMQKVVKQLPVVGPASGFPGLTSFVGPYYDHLKKRYNAATHKSEVRARVVKSLVRRKETQGYHALARFFIEVQRDKDNPYHNGFVHSSHTRDGMGWVDPALLV